MDQKMIWLIIFVQFCSYKFTELYELCELNAYNKGVLSEELKFLNK